MKHTLSMIALTALAVALTAGCHAQIPSNPVIYSCPAANTGTWTALETSATEITGLSTKDTAASIGVWCYAVTSIINTSSPIGQSLASNVVMVATTASDPVVDLSWTAPTSGPTPTGYIMYRIAANQSTITAPGLSTPSTSVSLLEPELPATDDTAAVVLMARVAKATQ